MAEQLSLESVGPRVGLRVVSVWYVQPHEHPIERSHAMARALLAGLPGARALEGEAEFMATKARREFPLPRKPSAWETRMRERMGRVG